jgi:hypothetical protein
MTNPRWRARREVYLRENGRTADLMREGFIAGKLEVVEGGRPRREVSKRQVTLILVASAGAKLLPEQKDCQ